MKNIKQKPIIILDFGSQYTQLIGRRIREMGVYCEIHPFDVEESVLQALAPCGVILSGGPSTVIHDANPRAPSWIFAAGIPLLGICYGMQTMAVQLGGQVESSAIREFGYAELRLHGHSRLLSHIEDSATAEGAALLDVWMSHGDKVTVLPPGFKVICETRNAPIAGMAHETRPWFGLQFHPEVTHTLQGTRILQRFVIDICQAQTNWTSDHIIEQAIAKIRQQVGDDHVLLALSGGVDSSVVAALLHRALGEQLTCVFVDTGLLRLNEAEQVMTMFGQHMGIKIIAVNAEEKFLKALQGVTCPETKRKIIGRTFIDVFEQEAKRFDKISWLAQGTIYPDVIESAATHIKGGAEVIKSHHNVGGLPEVMNLKLLEPIRELFKDEVRKIGLELGLPYEMVYRHPFPGPGLGVRILGEVKKDYADILRQADAIFLDELRAAGLYHEVSQAFAVFLPVRSVGVMGDGRRYDFVICLRAVKTIDFMTAEWAELPWNFLAHVSNRIINEVAGVSRVTYDISGKPPATIEWE
ncbi:glutamine-hydrolyzing GMP synthase [Legionella sp. 27cVA30]|uniref:glutamine-hydrolyzing GMP synthase n=1 Tax=Legionella sp. 27cVA30 TaxID=2905657 RepID=UPI0020A06A69|nr:glutamine-hydrolyzing GMP synthase [Legionella sp. 27cVA30]MCP0913457.1 glutamine-hydrolyzing GMP synthase [Legionella sp. 27cVA30]